MISRILKITSFVLLALVIILVVLLAIPGDVEPPQTVGAKLPPLPIASGEVQVHFFETAHATMPVALTMAQGSLFENFEMVYGALLVQHGSESFLFDTGLGRNVDQQFEMDMPAFLQPLMSYTKGEALVDQLSHRSDLPAPKRIFLSHAHWDHASGIVDFPSLPVWLPKAEREFARVGEPPAVFPSQVRQADIKWRPYEFTARPYAGFEMSYDVFGDGTVVLVNLSGHTPGSTGMFVNSSDGVRRFFVGDAVWNYDAIGLLRQKFWLSSKLAHEDGKAAAAVVGKLYALMHANPELKIIPAHDVRVRR